MKLQIFELSSKAAYLLWDSTNHGNALDNWYCAEDIASFFERLNLISHTLLEELLTLDKKDEEYINFVRNIAFRIYIYTNDNDKIKNWFIAESLLKNAEWTNAVLGMANYYRNNKVNPDLKKDIKSDLIRNYYNS